MAPVQKITLRFMASGCESEFSWRTVCRLWYEFCIADFFTISRLLNTCCMCKRENVKPFIKYSISQIYSNILPLYLIEEERDRTHALLTDRCSEKLAEGELMFSQYLKEKLYAATGLIIQLFQLPALGFCIESVYSQPLPNGNPQGDEWEH